MQRLIIFVKQVFMQQVLIVMTCHGCSSQFIPLREVLYQSYPSLGYILLQLADITTVVQVHNFYLLTFELHPRH